MKQKACLRHWFHELERNEQKSFFVLELKHHNVKANVMLFFENDSKEELCLVKPLVCGVASR